MMLQAPIKTDKPADADIARVKGPYYQWWIDAIVAKGPEDIEASVHAGVAYAAKYVEEHGPFDAVLGFSQGAVMATLLTRHLVQKLNPDAPIEPGQQLKLPWQGNICVCGSAIPSKAWETEYIRNPLSIPTLHVIGERDKVSYLFRRPNVQRVALFSACGDEPLRSLSLSLSLSHCDCVPPRRFGSRAKSS